MLKLLAIYVLINEGFVLQIQISHFSHIYEFSLKLYNYTLYIKLYCRIKVQRNTPFLQNSRIIKRLSILFEVNLPTRTIFPSLVPSFSLSSATQRWRERRQNDHEIYGRVLI